MNDPAEFTLQGVVRPGIGWFRDRHNGKENWERVIIAHKDECPEIETFFKGSLNVHLIDPPTWIPPSDESHRLNARRRGIAGNRAWATGCDFLFNGNYIHPTIRVKSINGIPIVGYLYFPGVDENIWPLGHVPKPRAVRRIEILSTEHIRDRLMFENNADQRVIVVLNLDAEEA